MEIELGQDETFIRSRKVQLTKLHSSPFTIIAIDILTEFVMLN